MANFEAAYEEPPLLPGIYVSVTCTQHLQRSLPSLDAIDPTPIGLRLVSNVRVGTIFESSFGNLTAERFIGDGQDGMLPVLKCSRPVSFTLIAVQARFGLQNIKTLATTSSRHLG